MNSTTASTAHTEPTIDRYQRIRDVALALFVSEGYSKVSLRQLGKESGLQAGSLYNHLHSKEELLFELIAEHLESELAEVRWRIARQTDVTTRLTTFIDSLIDSHVQHRSLSLLTSLELRSLSSSNRKAVNVMLKARRDCLAGIIAEGIKNGLFRPQPLPLAVQAILSMMSGIAFWFNEQQDLDPTQLKSHFIAMVLSAVGAPKA